MITRTHVLILFAIAAAGCSTARMPVDDTLASGEYLAVEGRQGWKIHERVTFGSYATENVDRSWTKGSGLAINEVEMNRRRQTYSFTFLDAGAPLYAVACEVRLRHGEVNTPIVDVEFRNRSTLDCSLDPTVTREYDRISWTLSLEEHGEKPLTGLLSSNGGTFDVSGTNKLKGGLPVSFTTGYYIRRDGRDIGAIEVVNDGAVRIKADLSASDKHAVAAAGAALLLLEDLRGSIEEV